LLTQLTAHSNDSQLRQPPAVWYLGSTLFYIDLDIAILDVETKKKEENNPITFGSRLPSSFDGLPTAAGGVGGGSLRASSGAAERASWRSGDASAIAPGRVGGQRSRGHAAAAGRRLEGSKRGPRIRVWDGDGEEVGVEMSRSMEDDGRED
jgi:hypothetical protein